MKFLQQKAVDIATEGHNLLLLGRAGTGKSFVLKEIAKHLKNKGKTVQITCSTGIACSVYPGNSCTIHQFTGISDGRYGPGQIVDVIKNNRKYEYVLDNISKIDTIILDECSMISQKLFDTINNVCKMKDPNRAFGGIQMIFCGDFLQLPPVGNLPYGDNGRYCFESDDFNTCFPHRVVLEENVRQSECDLTQAISEVFDGHVSPDMENFIAKLNRPLDNLASHTVKLFARNDLVDDYNRRCLLEFPGSVYEYKSEDKGKASDLCSISVPSMLWLKIGCPVILMRNLSNQLVNGLQGYVKDILEGSGPVVEFPSINITRTIPKISFTVYSPRLNIDIATREQYPLKLAFGLTIHKAQGMTLERAEVDCRNIFKAGQLGVAMSRVTTTAGLRVINYHPRYVIPPPQSVKDFMNVMSTPTVLDLKCCIYYSTPNIAQSGMEVEPEETVTDDNTIPQNIDIEDIDTENFEEEFDSEFDNVIQNIIQDETEASNFNIPPGFDIDSIMKNMMYKKEVTEIHTIINGIIRDVDKPRLITFVKKMFLKIGSFVTKLTGNKTASCGIPEKNIVGFYREVHVFSTGGEYNLNCLTLFEKEEFSDNHMIVCYNILEAVRLFFLKEKVDLLEIRKSYIMKRHVTDASRARVRYVAGYCLASLRKKYARMQKSHLCDKTKQGQDMYNDAKWIVFILNLLQEDELYLKEHTDEPASLIDVERRQYTSRGLTNVSDSLFKFFVKLTDVCLNHLVRDNLMKYGKNMYNKCLELISSDLLLYEQFANVIATTYSKQPIEEFGENMQVSIAVEKMVLISSLVSKVFNEFTEKYLMVLLAQFRKDVKSAFRIEKTMSHRKQIKVSKRKNESEQSSEQKPPKSKKSQQPQPETSTQNVQSEPQPGSSTQLDSVDDSSDFCQICFTDKDDEWILCDSCDGWYHRKCAGLKNARQWKKFSKEGITWLCKTCK